MEDKNLRSLLEELQNKIGQTKSKDEKGRSLLRELNSSIQEYLDSPEEVKKQAGENLSERLKDTIDHFEISYPTLTMLVSEAATILSNAGI